MNQIWKFPIPITDEVEVEMPEGSQVLTADLQKRILCLWAKVEPSAPKQIRKFRVVGTGHDIERPETLVFINTIFLHERSLVFHVFEDRSN